MDLSLYRELVFIQNNLLFNKIANTLFTRNEEKELFLNKYNKFNFTYSKIIKDEKIIQNLIDKKNILTK